MKCMICLEMCEDEKINLKTRSNARAFNWCKYIQLDLLRFVGGGRSMGRPRSPPSATVVEEEYFRLYELPFLFGARIWVSSHGAGIVDREKQN